MARERIQAGQSVYVVRYQDVYNEEGFVIETKLRLVEEHRGDAFRAVYTVRFEKAVYVLHCFQKKSTTGIRTA